MKQINTHGVVTEKIIIAFFFVFFVIFFSIYIPNMGGSGNDLPRNIIAWMLPLVIITTKLLDSIFRKKNDIKVSAALIIFVMGVVILCIPYTYTAEIYRENSSLRLLSLAGGAVFFITLVNFFSSCSSFNVQNNVLQCILLSCLIQAFISITQFMTPTDLSFIEFKAGQRPFGLFQHINVLASYQSVGVALSVYLLTTLKKWGGRQIIYLVALYSLSLNVIITQSQIGYLSLLVICTCLFFMVRRDNWKLYLLIGLSVFGGVATGIILLKILGAVVINHQTSTYIRWWMFKNCMEMFHEKFILGWGYGSFEHNYNNIFRSSSVFSHPHNEALLWLVEGGLIAFLGMILILTSYLCIFFHVKSSLRLIWIATLPISLHMLTEFPIYISVQHWLVLIILLAICHSSAKLYICSINKNIFFYINVILLVVALLFSILLLSAVFESTHLTTIERKKQQITLLDESHYYSFLNIGRYQYDLHVGILMLYNKTKNTKYLEDYLVWAKRYALVHQDKNVSLNIRAIEKLFSYRQMLN